MYVINGKRLRNCLSDEKLTLVYIWGPKCTSSVCIPLNIIQEECNRNNIELHIVAEYYDNRLMQINYDIKRPILGIDIDYYKRNLTSKYLSRFLNELSNTVADNSDNRYILYKNGNFSASFHSIENLIESITNKTSRRNINFEKQ